MEFEADILELFAMELIENYRHQIREREESQKTFHRQRKLSAEVDKKMAESHPKLYKLVTDYVGSIYDMNSIYQEQLYMQGVKDGIRIRRLVSNVSGTGERDQERKRRQLPDYTPEYQI